MRTAAIVYTLLVALATVNITQLFDLPWWLVVVVVAIVGVGLVLLFQQQRSNATLFRVLSSIGFISLFVIGIVLVRPVLDLLNQETQSLWSSNLIPLFASAIGFYGVGLWLRGSHASGADALDWLANFLHGPGLLLSLLTATVVSTGTLFLLEWLGQNVENLQSITRRFLERGIIPPITVLFFYWGMLILIGKWVNVMFLRTKIQSWKSQANASRSSHIDRILSLAEDTEKLDDRFTYLWRRHEESFTIPRYISWVVPVLGFIGTVLGISLAADGIRHLIASDAGISGLSTELGAAIAPLGIAFDTTLIALSLSVLLMLFQTLVQRSEDRSLNALERHLRESIRAY